MSDYTLKGERKATLKIEPESNYVIQVIAREDKGDVGIDYKYSDMVTSYDPNNPNSQTEDSQRLLERNRLNSKKSIERVLAESLNSCRKRVKNYPVNFYLCTL